MSMEKTAAFSQPLDLPCGARLQNRFMKSAMSERSGLADGAPARELFTLYKRWAAGGAGLLVTGNVMIDRRYPGEPGNVFLEDDRHMDLFREWAEWGQTGVTSLWMQINHPGRQIPAVLCKKPVAPSAVPLTGKMARVFATPRALTDQEVRDTIARYATTARLAREAGFAGVQVHGAHGYLVSQFLSPVANIRDDYWGGDEQRRLNFALEVYRAIRAAVGPDFPVSFKINAADFLKDGIAVEDSTRVAQALEKEGLDLLEISGGTYENPAMFRGSSPREAYFIEFADAIKSRTTTMPLALTGGFRSGAAMVSALQEGACDVIGIGRPLCVDPEFVRRLLQDPLTRFQLRTPSTGIKGLDQTLMLDVNWFKCQMDLMARGREPETDLGAWRSVFRMFREFGTHAFRKQRA